MINTPSLLEKYRIRRELISPSGFLVPFAPDHSWLGCSKSFELHKFDNNQCIIVKLCNHQGGM